MTGEPTPREALFLSDQSDTMAFAKALDAYRNQLLAAWQAEELEPMYCPYDCSHCHGDDCLCPSCGEAQR